MRMPFHCVARVASSLLFAGFLTLTGCSSSGGSGGPAATTGAATGADNDAATGTTSDTGTGADGGTPPPASCSDCVEAQSCCVALDAMDIVGSDGGECSAYSESACNAMSGADQASAAAACQDSLMLGRGSKNAACM